MTDQSGKDPEAPGNHPDAGSADRAAPDEAAAGGPATPEPASDEPLEEGVGGAMEAAKDAAEAGEEGGSPSETAEPAAPAEEAAPATASAAPADEAERGGEAPAAAEAIGEPPAADGEPGVEASGAEPAATPTSPGPGQIEWQPVVSGDQIEWQPVVAAGDAYEPAEAYAEGYDGEGEEEWDDSPVGGRGRRAAAGDAAAGPRPRAPRPRPAGERPGGGRPGGGRRPPSRPPAGSTRRAPVRHDENRDDDDLDDDDRPSPGVNRKAKRQVVVLSVLSIAVVLIGVFGFVLSRGASNKGTAAQSGAASGPTTTRSGGGTTVPPTEMTSFHDDVTGFTVKYPKSWNRLNVPVADIRTVLLPGFNDKNAVQIRIYPIQTVADQNNIGNFKAVTDAIVFGDQSNKLIQEQLVTLNGKLTYYYLYTFHDASTNQDGVHAHYFVFEGHRFFSIVFQTLPAEEFNRLAAVYDQVAESFTVEPEKPGQTVPEQPTTTVG